MACHTGDVIGFLHSDDLFVDNGVLSLVASSSRKDSVDAVNIDGMYLSLTLKR